MSVFLVRYQLCDLTKLFQLYICSRYFCVYAVRSATQLRVTTAPDLQ